MEEKTFQLFEAFDFEGNEQFQSGWKAIYIQLKPQSRASEYLRAKAFFFSRNVKQIDFEQYLTWKMSKQLDGKDYPVQEENVNESIENNHTDKTTKDNEESSLFQSKCKDSKNTSACNAYSVSALQSPTVKLGNEVESVETPEANSLLLGESKPDLHEENGLPKKLLKTRNLETVNNNACGDISSKTQESTDGPAEMYHLNNRDGESKLSLADLAELIQNNKPIPGVISLDVEPTNSNPTPSILTRRSKPWETVQQE